MRLVAKRNSWDVACLKLGYVSLRNSCERINYGFDLSWALTLLVSFIGLRANVSIEKDWVLMVVYNFIAK